MDMTKRERIQALRADFDEITETLERSGKRRDGTPWQTRRIKAREAIRRELEDLEDIPAVPSYNPAVED